MIKILLISLGVIFVIAILFFLFIIWGINKGFENKYGPTFIKNDLGLRFNHFNYKSNRKGKYVYHLTSNDSIDVKLQIEILIDKGFRSPNRSDYVWTRTLKNDFELFSTNNNKRIATFCPVSGELVYYIKGQK